MSKTNPDEYRWKCPKGHVTVIKVRTHGGRGDGSARDYQYDCRTCRIRYEGKPIDTIGTIE